MFHFISGYTSKMAGTEDGVTEPQATFSSCFAQPFLALHPMRYARMLADKISEHKASAWLLNTGWVGAGATTGGKRCPLKFTRAILDAIHSGELAKVEYEVYETFNLFVPKTCPGVPSELLNPKKSWTGSADFQDEVNKLAELFNQNFKKYTDQATPEVIAAGPIITKATSEVSAPTETKSAPLITPSTIAIKPVVEPEKLKAEKVKLENIESETPVQVNGQHVHVNGVANGIST
jgi:phosphoenolpyruvate carboxykinase (ATP)